RCRSGVDADPAKRIESDGGRRLCAVLGSRAPPVFCREYRGDVAHIRDARLDYGRAANAVNAPLRARCVAAFFQLGESAVSQRNVERMRIVAGIKQGAA